MQIRSWCTIFDHNNNSTVLPEQVKANILNSYFASVGVKDNGVPLNNCREIHDGVKLDSIDFTPDKLLKIMHNVKQNSAPGPDGFSPALLKHFAHCLAYPLSAIYGKKNFSVYNQV